MSYEFDCIVPGCEGKVEGETMDEVLREVDAHALDVHGIAELDEATMEAVKAGIVATG